MEHKDRHTLVWEAFIENVQTNGDNVFVKGSKLWRKLMSEMWKAGKTKNKHGIQNETNAIAPLEETAKGLRAWGCVEDRDGEGAKRWWIFEGLTLDEAKRELHEIVNIHGSSFNSAYDCTGQWFSWAVEFHENPTGLVTATQRWLMDV